MTPRQRQFQSTPEFVVRNLDKDHSRGTSPKSFDLKDLPALPKKLDVESKVLKPTGNISKYHEDCHKDRIALSHARFRARSTSCNQPEIPRNTDKFETNDSYY